MGKTQETLSTCVDDELRLDIEAESYRQFQENGRIRPMISDGMRSLLRRGVAARKGAGEVPPKRYLCNHCGGVHGAPYCFELNKPISAE